MQLNLIGQYKKIDLAKIMNCSINGMEINFPKIVERSFSLYYIIKRNILS